MKLRDLPSSAHVSDAVATLNPALYQNRKPLENSNLLPKPAPVPVGNTTRWTFVIHGTPIGKPRQTRRDKWAKRPCVLRYRAWADKARAAAPEGMTQEPLGVSWTAYFEMPRTWSKGKRSKLDGQPHRQKPDRDNCDKALLDSLFKQDCCVAFGTLRKVWCRENPRIEVEVTTE